MENNNIILLAYFIGAFLRLGEKARVYIYKSDKPTIQAFREWAFDKSLENGASWVATIGVVWIVGYLYVNQIPEFFGFQMPEIQVSAPVAFLLGCLMEQFAPNILKIIMSRLPFKKN